MKLVDLYQQLPDMTLFHEDYASDPQITIPDFDPRYSKVVGTMDGREVWGSRFFGESRDVYAFRDGETLLAFVVVATQLYKNHYRLDRIWVNPNFAGKGYVTALVQFVMKKAKNPLCLSSNDKLSDDGRKWLLKAIQTGRIVVKNESGKQVDIEQLKQEFSHHNETSTELFFEQQMSSLGYRLFATGYRTLNEQAGYIGDPTLD